METLQCKECGEVYGIKFEREEVYIFIYALTSLDLRLVWKQHRLTKEAVEDAKGNGV